MVHSCSVTGCYNRKGKDNAVSFYRFPADPERRKMWVAAMRRKEPTGQLWIPTEYSRLCSVHFISGRKSDNPRSPDYVPSLFAIKTTPKRKQKRINMKLSERQEKLYHGTQKDAGAPSPLTILSFDSESINPRVVHKTSKLMCHLNEPLKTVGDGSPQETGTSTQTDVNGFIAVCMQQRLHSLRKECQHLHNENAELKAELSNLSMDEKSFEQNSEKVKCYTGLPSYGILITLLNVIAPFLQEESRLSKFSQFLLTLMRIELHLNAQDLGYRFGVHYSTVSHIFQNVLDVCYTRLVPLLIKWPSREQLRLSLPVAFRNDFPKCVAVIDYFEIFIDRPSSLDARIETNHPIYKHDCIKYLISVAPQGVISFVSTGYGGKTSDKFIAENCGFLKHLQPGDLVLAERILDIEDIIKSRGARLEFPASFTIGTPQLESGGGTSRQIASDRTHIARCIRNIKQKYSMLSCIVPFTVSETSPDLNIITVDRIVHLTCALSNVCDSGVSFD